MSSCVYVIQADNFEIKVGVSDTPYARLSNIKKEYSNRRGFKRAYLVGFISSDFGLSVESLAHRMLNQYAVGGEWYRVHAFIALRAVIEAASLFESNIVVQTVGPETKAKLSVKTFRSLVRQKIGKYKK